MSNLIPFQPSPRFRDADPLLDISDWERDWLRAFDIALDRLPGPGQNLIRTPAKPTVLPDAPSAIIEEGKC